MVAAVLLSGCSSTGAIYREHRDIAPDGAQIVIFRPDEFFQGGIPYLVTIDGKESGVLRNGGFSVLGVAPGTVVIEVRAAHWMQASFRNRSLSVTTTAKERVFVRSTPELGNTVTLRVVSAAVATPVLQSLKESQ
jgi:hypothetical protein